MAVEVFMGACVDKLKKCYKCKKEMTEIGKLDVNQHQIYIKFTCTPAATT